MLLAGQIASNCAIVGSGGSLVGAGQGKTIDHHERIVRINQAPTASYEKHVGRRTDVRVLNNYWTKMVQLPYLTQVERDMYSCTSEDIDPTFHCTCVEQYASKPRQQLLEQNVTLLVTRADDDDYAKLVCRYLFVCHLLEKCCMRLAYAACANRKLISTIIDQMFSCACCRRGKGYTS